MAKDKNYGLPNNCDTNSQPFAVYRVEGRTHDKGGGITVKKAMKVFFENHPYKARIDVLRGGDKEFKATVSFFYDGNPDISITALQKHIEQSGNMTESNPKKPQIRITPIPFQGDLEGRIEDAHPDYIAWQKTVQGLNQQLKEYQEQVTERDETIEDLTTTLNSRQKVISEKDRELKTLRESIAHQSHRSPLKAILESYGRQFEEPLFEVYSDLETLASQGDINLFSKANEIEGLPAYINAKLGFNFESNEQAEEAMSQAVKYDKWEDTPEAQKLGLDSLEEQKKELEKDKQFLDKYQGDASKNLIEVANADIGSRQKEIDETEAHINQERDSFNKLKQAATQLSGTDLNQSYENFANIKNNSEERRSSNTQIPIIISTQRGEKPSFEIFVPSVIDSKNPFENHIENVLNSFLSDDGGYHLGPKVHDTEGFVRYVVKEGDRPRMSDKGVNTLTNLFGKTNIQDQTISTLGLNLKSIVLTEVSDKK